MKLHILWILLLPLTAECAAYVTQKSSALVDVIDTQAVQYTSSIAVEHQPGYLAMHPLGLYLYVSNESSGTVSVIDTEKKASIQELSFPNPAGIAIAERGNKGYVVSGSSLICFSTETFDVEFSIPFVGQGSKNLRLSPCGEKAYIALDSGIAYINLITKAALHIPLKTPIEGMAIDPKGRVISAASTQKPYSAFVIDTNTHQVLHQIDLDAVAEGGRSLVITPDGQTAFITGENTHNVVSFDMGTGEVHPPISVGLFPRGAAITPDGAFLYVANFLSDTVSKIDIASRTIVDTISLTDECARIALSPQPVLYNLRSEVKKNRFLFTTRKTLQISWDKPEKGETAFFEVYRGNRLLHKIEANQPLSFEDTPPRKAHAVRYTIIAVSKTGTRSKGHVIHIQ